MGYPRKGVYRRIRNAEYKRWQAAPCIKITPKTFGISMHGKCQLPTSIERRVFRD